MRTKDGRRKHVVNLKIDGYEFVGQGTAINQGIASECAAEDFIQYLEENNYLSTIKLPSKDAEPPKPLVSFAQDFKET